MKAIFNLFCTLILSAGVTTQALAHPHGSAASKGHEAPPAPTPLEPEMIASFLSGGSTISVWNTHNRGFFGTELIQFRNDSNHVVGNWWTSRGWCYTAAAYADSACHSQGGYIQLFQARLEGANLAAAPVPNQGASSGDDFCDHYSKIEYVISGDDSDVCDYGDDD